ncbi:recombinase family protein [Eubacteriales bacterium OttesenSCG-928-N13]|nr:recombinase family protein [Eubacteriales bacterium OttesenSCG-928-N13]
MMKVTKIDPGAYIPVLNSKLRVAAYCRVSTDSDEQSGSLETQIEHYEVLIRANTEWEYAGVYYDHGITGTKRDKRGGLLRLLADCENGKIDLVLTKSISRFARNTTDCLEIVRSLLDIGVFISFEKEAIHTGSMESELMLSILSGLAESESVSIAQNNEWSIQRRFQNGTYKISYAPYGYDAIDGELIVNDAQAKIVQFIFAEILSGKGSQKIATELNRRSVPTKKGGRWTATTIRGMIGNEKYTGDAIFQKTYTDAHFNRHRNDGEKDRYMVQNHHEAIISHDVFEAAQLIIAQRGKEKGADMRLDKCLNRYPFSGKIVCGECGGKFKRRVHTVGRHPIAWCCATHIEDAAQCSMKYIPESDIDLAFVTMMNKLIFGHAAILKPPLEALSKLNTEESLLKIQEIEQKLEDNAAQSQTMVGLRAKGYLTPAVYNRGNNELLQEAERLCRQKESLQRLMSNENQHLSKTRELLQFAAKSTMMTAFDGDVFGRFVERIIAYSRTEIGFELKCGITLRERLVK